MGYFGGQQQQLARGGRVERTPFADAGDWGYGGRGALREGRWRPGSEANPNLQPPAAQSLGAAHDGYHHFCIGLIASSSQHLLPLHPM